MRVALLTCDRFPSLIDTECRLIDDFADLGITAEAVIWDKVWDYDDYDLLIIRNTWDYYKKSDTFKVWLDHVESHNYPLINPVTTIRWNMDKLYLNQLKEINVPLVPSLFIQQNSSVDELKHLIENIDWKKIVVKPSISAGSWDTYLLTSDQLIYNFQQLYDLNQRHSLIFQKYMDVITQSGEYSYIFFNGRYQYAVNKKPKSGDFRVQKDYGGQYLAHQPNRDELQLIENILGKVSYPHYYARVDGVWDESFYLMEIELIEPDLYLNKFPGAYVAFVNEMLSIKI